MPRTGSPRKYASKAEKAKHDVIAQRDRRRRKASSRSMHFRAFNPESAQVTPASVTIQNHAQTHNSLAILADAAAEICQLSACELDSVVSPLRPCAIVSQPVGSSDEDHQWGSTMRSRAELEVMPVQHEEDQVEDEAPMFVDDEPSELSSIAADGGSWRIVTRRPVVADTSARASGCDDAWMRTGRRPICYVGPPHLSDSRMVLSEQTGK
jgi:hypothetical protein